MNEHTPTSPPFRRALLALLLGLSSLATLTPASALAVAPPPTGQVLTAADVVRLAMDHSPSLAIAVDEVSRAGLLVESEDHRYRPIFTADAGWTHNETPSLSSDRVRVAGSDDVALAAGIAHTFPWGTSLSAELSFNGAGRDFTQPDTATTLRLGPTYGVALQLRADQPLLRGLGTDLGEAGLRSARQSRTAAELARQRTASETANDVLSAYWDLWYAQAAQDIQERALEVAQRQLRDAEVRLEVGAIAAFDVLPLRTELASIRESLSAARGTTRQRQVALSRLLGVSLTAGVSAAAEVPATPALRWDETTVAEAAASNAYELAELQTAVERARIDAVVAGEQSKAQLDLSAWVAFEGLGDEDAGAAFEMFGTGEAVSGFVGLSLELPFDNTQRRNDAARARLSVKTAQARLQDATERTVAGAVSSLERVRTTQDRVTFSQETARIAAESATGQQARFDAGSATATELVVAEQQRRQAELRVARARADLAIAYAGLQHVIGALLDEVATLTRPG